MIGSLGSQFRRISACLDRGSHTEVMSVDQWACGCLGSVFVRSSFLENGWVSSTWCCQDGEGGGSASVASRF